METTNPTSREDSFRYEYDSPIICFGEGCLESIETELSRVDGDRALVVSGRTVGSRVEVMEPVTLGMGDAFAGLFDETTTQKRLGTALEGAAAYAEADADAILAVGGGSSIDLAKAIRFVVADDRSPEAIADEFERIGTLTPPDDPLPPMVVVPTTLAGADLSIMAGLSAAPEGGHVDTPQSGGLSDARLMPSAVFYDPALVATTPRDILAGSAMNGFDKGIESLYATSRTPITDAAAMRGIELLREGLPTLSGGTEDAALDEILQGSMLVQYGISRPDGTTLALIHAFGHGLTAHSDIQQGVAHGVMAPVVLEYLFEQVHGRRELLATALGVDTDGRTLDEISTGVVDAVTEIRNSLGMPSRLSAVDDLERSSISAIAETTSSDYLIANVPSAVDVDAEALEAVLDRAW